MSLPALNRAKHQVDLRVIRQALLRDGNSLSAAS